MQMQIEYRNNVQQINIKSYHKETEKQYRM